MPNLTPLHDTPARRTHFLADELDYGWQLVAFLTKRGIRLEEHIVRGIVEIRRKFDRGEDVGAWEEANLLEFNQELTAKKNRQILTETRRCVQFGIVFVGFLYMLSLLFFSYINKLGTAIGGTPWPYLITSPVSTAIFSGLFGALGGSFRLLRVRYEMNLESKTQIWNEIFLGLIIGIFIGLTFSLDDIPNYVEFAVVMSSLVVSWVLVVLLPASINWLAGKMFSRVYTAEEAASKRQAGKESGVGEGKAEYSPPGRLVRAFGIGLSLFAVGIAFSCVSILAKSIPDATISLGIASVGSIIVVLSLLKGAPSHA